MVKHSSQRQLTWLVVGVLAGMALSYYWPHEPALAATNDRNEKFAMATVSVKDVTIQGIRDTLEGVFVLDFLTGRMQGHVLGRRGIFTHGYYRDLAKDFEIDPKARPYYAFVSGNAQVPSFGPQTMATGVVYVGELTSGRVIAYAFPYNDAPRPVKSMGLRKMDAFQFRQPVAEQ